MTAQEIKLLLVCGKIASGKSTLLAHLVKDHSAVVLSEDHWNATLFPGKLKTLEDYVKYSARVRQALGPHIVSLLQHGVSVALDFPANTVRDRKWLKSLYEAAGVAHELHYLSVPDEVCKERLWVRNEAGEHQFTVSEAQFDQFTKYFESPTVDEAFNVILHDFHST
ncbi:ATP-binding protein [Pseudovibrio sp. Tun.PSC04-5.I4]|uniref:AAA family ATPase n=1 Tax=Pseudovibrio sp. Tun.PSC04-5.I4 TaxID=1798213 RepID=UPI0008923600|nr:ATP-binding protein [Pseudovibrio sp. Tun.PSC04-5.I4]SDR47478.1 Predicted kinase [Pseudovibrio sp. Tun.PSC04-5.I4]